jgi:hypothetical protein
MRTLYLTVFLFLLISSIGVAEEFFPSARRWMFTMLNIKSRQWSKNGWKVEVLPTKGKKVQIRLHVPRDLYLQGPKWRKEALSSMKFLSPKIISIIRKYSPREYLQLFDPKFDIIWVVLLGETPYGIYRDGKLLWKRGIH